MKEYENLIKQELENKIFSDYDLEQQKKILFGTFGYHDGEPPHSIIRRKIREVCENQFGLWGTAIGIESIEHVRQFCEQIDGNVYVFLKFTNSTKQGRSDNPDKEIWSIERIMEDGNYYSAYIDENENRCELNFDKTHIIVKGSKRQNTAFMVEDYFFYENRFCRKELLSCYEGTLYNGNEKKSGEDLCTRSPYYLLERKPQSSLLKLQSGLKKSDWAIVLKLKKPYLVGMM